MRIEQLHELFDLDAHTGVLRWKVNHRVAKAGDTAGTPHSRGYLQVRVDGRHVFVHRAIFGMVHGHIPKEVDHRNGIKTDNRPSNLRAASHAENNRNVGIQANNTSGVKGVRLCKKTGRWRAECTVDRKKHCLGRHDAIADAEAAVRAFRELHHGEFARHA